MVILDKPLYICIKEGVVILTLANLPLAEFGDEHKISGRDWIKYSISVWDDKKSNEERSSSSCIVSGQFSEQTYKNLYSV